MDSEDLLALRKLYGLLTKQDDDDAASASSLDPNGRRLLKHILDSASDKAFEAHAKIIGTQSYMPMPQGQSTQPLSFTNQTAYPKIDTQEISSDPVAGVRLKRCRVCRKPKVKQLTKEISFGGLYNQNHKRRWEDPAITTTNQEELISRDASTKILQLDSCISSLQLAAKHPDFFKIDLENQQKQKTTGYFSLDPNTSSTNQKISKPRDQLPTNALALPLLPSSQIVSQQLEEPAVKKTEMFVPTKNHIPEEAYYLFHSGGISSNLKTTADENHRNLSSLINMDQLQVAKEQTSGNPPVGYGRPNNEQQIANFIGRNKPGKTYNDHQRGKHEVEVVDPKRLVSAATQGLSDSPVSSSNHSTQSPSQSQISNSLSDSEGSSLQHRKVYSGSSRSRGHEKNESEMNSASKYQSPSTTESSGIVSVSRRTVPKKGDLKRKSESKTNTVSIWVQSSYMSSSSNESSRSRETVPKRGNRKGDQKEPKRKHESKMNMVSNSDQSSYTPSSSDGSNSSKMVPKKGYPKDLKKKSESKMITVSSQDQRPYTYTSSSSNESSVSGSRRMIPKKCGNQKEPKRRSEKKINTEDQSSYTSSGSTESSGSRSMMIVPKKGNQKEPRRRSENKITTKDQSSYTSSGSSQDQSSYTSRGSSQDQSSYTSRGSSQDQISYTSSGSNESSGSSSRMMVHHQKGKRKESKVSSSRDQSSYTSRSSTESSESRSRVAVPKKGSQKRKSESKMISRDQSSDMNSSSNESSGSGNEKNLTGPLNQLKDKLAIIFHHHHHHHHHHHDEDNNKKLVWKHAKKVIGHQMSREKLEAHGEQALKKALVVKNHGEQAVKKIGKKALVVKNHGEQAAKKIGKKALVVKNHGEQAVKKIENMALVVKNHGVKKIDYKALVVKKHGEQAGKNKALVVKNHGEQEVKKKALAVKNHAEQAANKKTESKAIVVHNAEVAKKTESKAIVVHKVEAAKKTESKAIVVHEAEAAKKNESKAIVVHKAEAAKKNESKAIVLHKAETAKKNEKKAGGKKQKSQLPLQALVSGALMAHSITMKPSKSKSVLKRSPSRVSGQKQGGGGQKMQWLQMLRQQRKIKRLEKLSGKMDIGKKR